MVLFWVAAVYLLITSNSEGHKLDVSEIPLVVPDPVTVKGLQWLEKQREANFGYQDNTAKAVLALQLANVSSWYNPDNLLSLLTVKQMDIEILLKFIRRHESPPSPVDLAFYSLAMNSLCRDPRQFYGHDLISNINHQEILLDTELAVSSLAICTSGTHVRKRQIRRLLDVTEQDKEINVETISMVVLALHCIIHDHRNRNLHHYLVHPTKKLGNMQNDDGSFGEVKSSALAAQALQSTDPMSHHWNRTAAISFLKRQQNEDGSFGKDDVIYTTILVLLALGPQGLVKVKEISCHFENSKTNWPNPTISYPPTSLNKIENTLAPSNKTLTTEVVNISNKSEVSTPESTSDALVTVSYTLWVGSNVTETHNINITTDNNNTFYNVMQLAAQKDDHFSFLSTEWPNGHYVHTLAGYKEEPMSYHYWLLYKLPIPPDLASPPSNQFVAPVGVDELLVENGDHFLFWYKKL